MTALVFVLLMFLVSVATILTIDNWITGCISGGSLLAIMAAGLLLSWWHGRRVHRARKKSELRRVLARLLAKNGTALVLLALLLPLPAVGFDGELSQALVSATEAAWPAVVLSAAEFQELQAIALRVAVLYKTLQESPPEMPQPIRDRRWTARRELERVHSTLTDVAVIHAASILKGGAR